MAQNWCFTLNNYTEAELDEIAHLVPDKLSYVAYAKETAPTTGTPHLQGFLRSAKKCRMSGLSKLMPRASFSIMKGTIPQNITYCSKEAPLLEIGERPRDAREAGKQEKERWKRARLAIEENRLDEVPDDIYIRYVNSIPKIQALARKNPGPIDTLDNYWYYGKTGSGKSTKAMTHGEYYRKACNKWWCGYKDEPVVIIDDIGRTHEYLGDHLKIWADHNDFRAETKGGSIIIRPKTIVVTSNYSIEQLFVDPNVSEPLLRRFKQIKI